MRAATPVLPSPSATPSSTGLQGASVAKGSVVLPTGVSLAATGALTAADSLGTAPVASNGGFSVNTFTTDPQFVTVNTAGGTSVLAGWLGSEEPTINTFTTAEVYLYYATFVYTLPDPTSRAEVIASIHTLPGLSTVQGAIANALLAHPTQSPASDPGVQKAIASLVSALTSSSAMNLRAGAGLTQMAKIVSGAAKPFVLGIQPGTSASGITIVEGATNTIQFQNTLRREAAAYVDDISHVDASGNTVKDNAPDTASPVPILAVNGIGSFGGAISDYLRGNYALVPTLSAAVEVPNVEGAKSTLYRVAIVGPGANLGDFASMTPVEQEKQKEQCISTVIFEVTLPLIASIIVPNAKFGGFSNGTANALVQDVIATLASDARVSAAAETGSPEDLLNIVSADIIQSTAITDLLCEALLEQLVTKTLVSQASNDAILVVSKLAPFIRITDAGIAVIDTLLITNDLSGADRGNIFMVTATDPTTTLTPATSSIVPNATVTLTVGVHPPDPNVIGYQYTNTAVFGTLTDASGIASHVNNFSSSLATVTYTANATGGGSDTITVTPIEKVPGQQSTNLASATATVAVGPAPSPTPTDPNQFVLLDIGPFDYMETGNAFSGTVVNETIVYSPFTENLQYTFTQTGTGAYDGSNSFPTVNGPFTLTHDPNGFPLTDSFHDTNYGTGFVYFPDTATQTAFETNFATFLTLAFPSPAPSLTRHSAIRK
jgi:hypothetical protein